MNIHKHVMSANREIIEVGDGSYFLSTINQREHVDKTLTFLDTVSFSMGQFNDKSNIDRELFDTSRGQSCLITPELSREEIVKYRKSLGMTQKQFADEFSIPLGTLRRWEQGQNNPQLTANVARLFTQVVMNKASE